MPRDERGFTIIELLIVLVITSVISSFGLSVNRNLDKKQLLVTAKEIQTLIRNAQQVAYGEQSTNIVAFYYTLGECTHIQNAKVINTVIMPSNIYMGKTNFTDGKLYFRKHLSPNMGGTIVLYSKRYTVKITVLPVTGRVKIYPIDRR